MATKYDAIVIGTGQAAPYLAVRLAGTRMKVAIIERKRFGGICVNSSRGQRLRFRALPTNWFCKWPNFGSPRKQNLITVRPPEPSRR
jgi:choline dehydrogenase-like flavoprotein